MPLEVLQLHHHHVPLRAICLPVYPFLTSRLRVIIRMLLCAIPSGKSESTTARVLVPFPGQRSGSLVSSSSSSLSSIAPRKNGSNPHRALTAVVSGLLVTYFFGSSIHHQAGSIGPRCSRLASGLSEGITGVQGTQHL